MLYQVVESLALGPVIGIFVQITEVLTVRFFPVGNFLFHSGLQSKYTRLRRWQRHCIHQNATVHELDTHRRSVRWQFRTHESRGALNNRGFGQVQSPRVAHNHPGPFQSIPRHGNSDISPIRLDADAFGKTRNARYAAAFEKDVYDGAAPVRDRLKFAAVKQVEQTFVTGQVQREYRSEEAHPRRVVESVDGFGSCAEPVGVNVPGQGWRQRLAGSALEHVYVLAEHGVHILGIIRAERRNAVPETLVVLGVGPAVVQFECFALGEKEALEVALKGPQRRRLHRKIVRDAPFHTLHQIVVARVFGGQHRAGLYLVHGPAHHPGGFGNTPQPLGAAGFGERVFVQRA